MVAQASLGAVDGDSPDEQPTSESGSTDQSNGQGSEADDPYEFVKYLDVDSPKLIRGLAGAISSVEEANKFIEAEEKRWARDDVLRVLNARKEYLAANTPDCQWNYDRVSSGTKTKTDN